MKPNLIIRTPIPRFIILLVSISIFCCMAVSTLLAASPVKKVLFVYGTNSSPKESSENYERLFNTLEGIGLPFDTTSFDQLDLISLIDYQLVIIAWSNDTFWREPVSLPIEQNIINAINQGINFLWLGPGIWGNKDLPGAFGVTFVEYKMADTVYSIKDAEFTDLSGASVRFAVKPGEFVYRVSLNGAVAEGLFYKKDGSSSHPFITHYQSTGKGKAVFISLGIMDWWKENEAEDTYARTEVLIKYIRKLTNQGYVGKHSARDGKEAVFLLRLEDYTPGGTMMLGNPEETWIDRLDNLIYFLKNTGLKLNMAIIPRYAHPCLVESHTWGDADQGIPLLKRYAQTVMTEGGSLITHGYKHQVGIGREDFSGGDYEMCLFPMDQVLCDTRANTCGNNFRSLAEQKQITESARAEMAVQFNYTPLVWETPHYAGNQDTYRSAADSGFQFFTESDTMLYPNNFGYLNLAQGLIMNIPETAFDFQDDPTLIAQMEPIKKDYILPRLVRLNSPYYTFFHNTNLDQYKSLVNVINKARTYDLWYPSLEEFGLFWKSRNNVAIISTIDPAPKKMTASVINAFTGFTLTFRLPDGASPGSVFINGTPATSLNKLVDGVQLMFVTLPTGMTATVEVNYN
jgi:Uncharacterized protein conserved in bacteria (DUF2334)